jgi:transcriptional regulator with XRE-family HTH domain
MAQPQKVTRIGTTMRRLRKLRGMSQKQLSEASGVDQASLSNMERGTIEDMKARNVAKLERVLKCPGAIYSAYYIGDSDDDARKLLQIVNKVSDVMEIWTEFLTATETP